MAKKERVYKSAPLPQYERDYADALHGAARRAELARTALSAQGLPEAEEDRLEAEITAAERAERAAANAVYLAAAANAGS